VKKAARIARKPRQAGYAKYYDYWIKVKDEWNESKRSKTGKKR